MSKDYRYRYLAGNASFDSMHTALVNECNKWVDVLNESMDELKALNERYGVVNMVDAMENLPNPEYGNYRLAYIDIEEKHEEAYAHYKQLKEDIEGEKADREVTLKLSDEELKILGVEHITSMYQGELEKKAGDILHGLLEDYAKMSEEVTVYFYNVRTVFDSRKSAMDFYMQSIREEKFSDALKDYAVILAKLDAGEKEIYFHCMAKEEPEQETLEADDWER